MLSCLLVEKAENAECKESSYKLCCAADGDSLAASEVDGKGTVAPEGAKETVHAAALEGALGRRRAG